MANTVEKKFVLRSKNITLTYEHNPYSVEVYAPKKGLDKTIVFPIFNYQGNVVYRDLISRIVEQGYKVVTVSLLNHGDRVLFFNYYYDVFEELLEELHLKRVIGNEELIAMGIGLGANIASYANFYKNKELKFSKIILISPYNRYKCDYRISREIGKFNIPTHIFYGQFDKINDVKVRYALYSNAKNNPNVHFSCYPATGYFLYYSSKMSLEHDELFNGSGVSVLVGESRKDTPTFLPEVPEYNEPFFKHLFNTIEGIENPKRIALLTDTPPVFINGVETVVELLQKQLNKMGYEAYVVALWHKQYDLDVLPNDHFVPIFGKYARYVKGYKELALLKSTNYQRDAHELAMFGFSYLHLHTEYSMSQVALELSKITNIRMPYTFHTIWKMYYEHKFGKLAGEVTYKAAKDLFFDEIYKACPTIIVPSMKSYQVLMSDSSKKKDVRIIPSPVNPNNFTLTKSDRLEINKLRVKYKLMGKKVLGYVGRVSTEKNIMETIKYISEVVSEIPNLIFMVVGVGDATKQLIKYAKKLKVNEHIIYVGQVPNEQVKYYYQLFDVFVTASNFETQGITYFEAASSGTLILAKKDKAIEGVFEDGETAYVYDGFESWLERLEKALFSDNKAITDTAKNMMKQYSPEKWAKKMLSIYTELNPDKK